MADITGTALSKLYAIITGDTSPVYANTYSRHNVANLVLPAVSVDVVGSVPDDTGAFGSSEMVENHIITLSVRVHVAYLGGYYNSTTAISMIDDLRDEILSRDNRNLSNGYRIDSVVSEVHNQEFSDSASLGSELIVTINKVGTYA